MDAVQVAEAHQAVNRLEAALASLPGSRYKESGLYYLRELHSAMKERNYNNCSKMAKEQAYRRHTSRKVWRRSEK